MNTNGERNVLLRDEVFQIVGAKVIDRITDIERGQMLNYLRITKMRVGLILNFKNPKLEWERLVL
jgi:GxxExxY protein